MPDYYNAPSGLRELSQILCAALREMLLLKGGYDFSREPVFIEKNVVSFHHRLRVDGLEKFGARAVFSAVKFYVDHEALERDRPIGALIIFVEADHLARLLWSLDYLRLDEDDEEVLLDACGTLTNLIAGYFVKELYDRGFVHLQMSHFENYFNTALNGIAFASDETKKDEISFWIKGEKRIVAELTMGHVPRLG